MVKTRIPLAAALSAAIALAGTAGAQLPNPFAPPTDAMDTLSGSSATGGLDSGAVLDRVRGNLNQGGGGQTPPANPFGGPAPGGPPASPFGGGAPAPPGGNPFGEDDAGFSGPVSVGGGLLKATQGLGGTRIRSAISGVILQDARAVSLIISDGYFDDGATAGDQVAGDNVFTNITEDSKYISPEEFHVRAKLVNALGALEKFSPQDFFQVRVATTDPVSSLPKLIEVRQAPGGEIDDYEVGGLELERDNRLFQWGDRFMLDYRSDKGDRASALIPAFLPPPPQAPNLPLPATFSPRANFQEQAAGGAEGGGPGGPEGRVEVTDANSLGDLLRGRSVDDPTTGQPVGAASSRYF